MLKKGVQAGLSTQINTRPKKAKPKKAYPTNELEIIGFTFWLSPVIQPTIPIPMHSNRTSAAGTAIAIVKSMNVSKVVTADNSNHITKPEATKKFAIKRIKLTEVSRRFSLSTCSIDCPFRNNFETVSIDFILLIRASPMNSVPINAIASIAIVSG